MSATMTRPAEPQQPPTRPAPPATGEPPAAAGSPLLARLGFVALLIGTAVLYLWRLGDSGYANTFYAAAAQAGSMSWKAMLFGSLDPSNAITVDKPPASLWLMGMSGRIFGFSSWSMLVPQALCGVGAVALLYATVRRVAGSGAALVAGALFALTPVAVLMFRFNNPDALLVLLMVGAAYAVTRAVERAGTRWLVLAGTLIGFAFLTKMLQAFLVLPAFGLVYLVAAPATLRRRLLDLLAALAAVIVSAGWWVALVELWPAGSRPYIGGSTNNSALELALGYNGLSRLTGGSGGGPGGGGGGGGNTGFGGSPGLTRLFNDSIGGEISWLLPAALIALAGGLFLTWRRHRTDASRAGLLLWGGWLLVTAAVFSTMSGVFHPYYNVALAPSIAAVSAIGGTLLWRARALVAARLIMAAGVAVTGWWSLELLDRTPNWHPELLQIVLVATLVAVVAILAVPLLGNRRAATMVAGVAAAIALLAGPAAFSLATAGTPHGGSIPASGPSVAGNGGGTGGGGGDSQPADAELAVLLQQDAGLHRWAAATTGSGSAGPLQLASGQAVMAIGGFNGGDPAPTVAEFQAYVAAGDIHYYVVGGQGGGPAGGGAPAQGAAGTGTPPGGGGAPPSGVPGGGNDGGGGSGAGSRQNGSASEIAAWVAANYTATTIGGATVYDLTATR